MDNAKKAISTRALMLGKADWLWDNEMDMHIPCCTIPVYSKARARWTKCGNGPLVGIAIDTGDCGEHTKVEKTDNEKKE